MVDRPATWVPAGERKVGLEGLLPRGTLFSALCPSHAVFPNGTSECSYFAVAEHIRFYFWVGNRKRIESMFTQR